MYEVCEDVVGTAVRVFDMVVWRGESPTGEVGEVGSFAPDESFVRFFFKNPRVGMRRLAESVEKCGEAQSRRCRALWRSGLPETLEELALRLQHRAGPDCGSPTIGNSWRW